jgi:hypothetical protein
MTQKEANDLLLSFHILGLAVGALLHEDLARETCWFRLEKACGQPIRKFLATIDPGEDPAVLLQGVQAMEAIREDGVWLRLIQEHRELPQEGGWN